MGKGIIVFTLLMCATICFKQTDNKPVFKFTAEKYDFGKISKDRPATTSFEFTNIGEEPLILSDVKPTTASITVDYTKGPIAKNAKGVIKVNYNAAATGVFSKSILITSNAKTPQKVIIILGEVIP